MLTAADLSPQRLHDVRLQLGLQSTRLRLARALSGLSRLELSRRAEISIDSLGALERGDRRLYTEEAMRICQALDVPADFLRGSGVSTELLLNAFCGLADLRARELRLQQPIDPEAGA